jgi:two-component system phosphate regulon sensor histidine kinase PhoR
VPVRREELRRLRHDLRTPLTIVSGFAELMAGDRPMSDENRRDYARRILTAAHEIRELIEGLDLGEPEPEP